jgi:protein SCO1
LIRSLRIYRDPRFSLMVALFASGCVGPDQPVPSASARRDFPFTGTVERVEAERGEVSIAHDDIPGLMPAMVMNFNPTDRSLLEDVRPGDEVEGTLRALYSLKGQLDRIDLTELVVSRPAIAEPPPPAPAKPVLKAGEFVPDFSMTSQDGTPFRLSDLRGHVVVLTFVYTRCPLPEFCPLMDRKFADLAERASRTAERAEQIRLLSVSFDPEHDGPATLTSHAARVGARPPQWQFAVASHDELRKVAEPLGLEYAPLSGQIRHNLSTAVIAEDGTLARLEQGNAWSPSDLFKLIRELVSTEKTP